MSFRLLTSSDSSLITPLNLLFSIGPNLSYTFGLLVTLAAVFFFFHLITLEKLMFLYFINRVIAILIYLLLSGYPIRLIIFNQNCLSIGTFLFRWLLINCGLINCFRLGWCFFILFYWTLILSLLCLSSRWLLLTGRISLYVSLRWVAYV